LCYNIFTLWKRRLSVKRKRAVPPPADIAPEERDRRTLAALIAFAYVAEISAISAPGLRMRLRKRRRLVADVRILPAGTFGDGFGQHLGALGFSEAEQAFRSMTPAAQVVAQSSLRDLLEQVAAGGFVAWAPPDDQLHVTCEALGMVASPGRGPERRLRRQGWFEGPAVFWGIVTELVERAAPALLRRCATCGALFAKRKRQKYCALPKNCSQRARSAKYYATNQLRVLRRRHQAYVARRREIQPGAVVPRRPRITASTRRRASGARKQR
jgi:hypothetical protein